MRKTGRLLVAHEHPLFGGFGGEIASLAAEHAFQHLDAPPVRLGSKDSPVPFSRQLEHEVLLQEKEVYDAALKLSQF